MGTFTGLAEGATITDFRGSGLNATITYVGGSGNDVVITVQCATISPPTVGTITQPSCATATGSVVLSGLPSIGTWTLTHNPVSYTHLDVYKRQAPVLTYSNASVNFGNATTVSPTTGPSDNGSISGIIVQSVSPATAPATLTVDNVTGVVTVPNNVLSLIHI